MLEIYTDGSCLGNPGRGGWAAISEKFKIYGAKLDTTNNIMEMTAIIKSLEHCLREGFGVVCIYTDSNYVKQGITSWIKNWKRNGWKTASGTPVKNKELWIKLDELTTKLDIIDWKWVKAHNGNPQNEAVDKLARNCANNLIV
jgi:ribonuclease HI